MPKRGAYSSLSEAQKRKFHKVMKEFARKTLRSSAGGKVTDHKQAVAIAFSEARSA